LDVIIIGNNALMTAVRAFADSNAEDFSAFAAPFIERAIVHAVTSRNC
jgi:DNA-directed RNA polymerase specialized sigma subunit